MSETKIPTVKPQTQLLFSLLSVSSRTSTSAHVHNHYEDFYSPHFRTPTLPAHFPYSCLLGPKDGRALANIYLCLGERCVQSLVFDLWFHCPLPPPVSSTDHMTSTRAQNNLFYVQVLLKSHTYRGQPLPWHTLSCPQEGS